MGQRFKTRKTKEPAGALDGVNQAEHVVENLCVVRLLLELHKLDVNNVQALVRLCQKFA